MNKPDFRDLLTLKLMHLLHKKWSAGKLQISYAHQQVDTVVCDELSKKDAVMLDGAELTSVGSYMGYDETGDFPQRIIGMRIELETLHPTKYAIDADHPNKISLYINNWSLADFIGETTGLEVTV
ncbi:hypothetical protein [Bifidobacterium callitrichidarum]|uniref:Uncharacterized protein n=1 Tax=Bifidobacterium callitrichidarum TaxID=2052941 RepID=A0A2U2N8X8_9BIFI|nr:hypothetical protein [Bifidobacterium callitrichidarum]PWG65625.1 hypothetical protein DF196_06745 [Bifidobacterium callitrichidarum]